MAQAAGPLALAVWLSPLFPVGGFAYSHGLEQAQEDGSVTDRASLEAWLVDLIEHGSWRSDAVLASVAVRAAERCDETALVAAAELAAALSPTRERRLETLQQGRAFAQTISAAWPNTGTDFLRRCWPGEVAFPIALGAACAGHGVGCAAMLEAYGMAFAQSLVSAAIRLAVVGQTDGQRVIAALLPKVVVVAAIAGAATLDDVGSCAFRSDLASMRHETQYTRLFRS